MSIPEQTAPKMQKVKSSNLSAAGYDKDSKVLHVQFHSGAKWEYLRVPEEKWDELLKAKSKGQYFTAEIKDKHFGRPLNETKAELKHRAHITAEITETEYDVTTPIHRYLTATQKKLKQQKSQSLLYWLWVTCGKEPRDKPFSRYSLCLEIIARASTINQVGYEHLDAAIVLARKEKL